MAVDEDLKERQRLYEHARDELSALTRSASENYDRSLLTLSSAFLGGSLALTSQVIDLAQATTKWLLYLSWLSFAVTIVLTLGSLIYGMFTYDKVRRAAERYYLRGEQDAWNISYEVQRRILRFVLWCGVSFGLGIACLGAFVSVNVFKERTVSQKPATPRWDEHSIPPGTFQTPIVPQPSTPAPATPAPTPSAPEKKS